MIYSDMRASPGHRYVPGKCAKCGGTVHESLALLDDAYNVWAGKCPHCKAINLLGLTSLRGYSSGGMDLVLPTDEEKEANQMPADCPTSGPSGKPADMHGTVAGEIYHQLGAMDKP